MRPLVLLTALTWSIPASAHIHMLEPAVRYEAQKNGPCGATNDARTDNVTILEPGATIQVVFEETISHPGYYRIAFDEDGQDNLGDPESYDGPNPPDVLVLADNLPDGDSVPYVVEVTLPDVECENCTLQLVQVMTDKAPYGDGNDLYYQCADLILRAGSGTGTEPPDEPTDTAPPTAPGTDDTDPPEAGDTDDVVDDDELDDKGCSTTGTGAGWLAVGLALLTIRRRRA